MAETIKLVQGDNRPYIRLTLRTSDGLAMDLTGTTVNVYFRAKGSTTILSTLACTIVSAATGEVMFHFPGTTLDVEPGAYEGEIEVNFGTEVQTVYEILKFSVRAQFN